MKITPEPISLLQELREQRVKPKYISQVMSWSVTKYSLNLIVIQETVNTYNLHATYEVCF